MNIAYKKLSAVIFSAMVTASMHGMEDMGEVTIEQVTPAVWYRKGSVQAAVVATTALVVAVVALRAGKLAIPAFMAVLVGTSQTVAGLAPNSDVSDEISGQTTEVNNQEIKVGETAGALESTNVPRNVLDEVTDFVKNIKIPVWNHRKDVTESMTADEFEQINEELVR